DDFFRDLWPKAKTEFSKNAILESMRGDFMLPSALSLVPSEFADTNGQPLIPFECSKFIYASPKYPTKAHTGLESLGVNLLSAEEFLDDLSNFITNYSDKFRSMSGEWHSQLSKILDPLTLNQESIISLLRFVPLQDGTWIAPQDGPLLFPLES